MTFSSIVKEELSEFSPESRHCCIAELSAYYSFDGYVKKSAMGSVKVVLITEKLSVARKCFTLLRKTFNIHTEILIRTGRNTSYILVIRGYDDAYRFIRAIKINESLESRIALLTGNFCCRRSFLRGAFLSVGSITDPKKSYHLEFACQDEEKANAIKSILESFEIESAIEAKLVKRKNNTVVYIKEGSQIALVLNIMEAHRALMEMENQRIVKEMRNTVNRRVNCETANINKTVNAAMKQVEDIEYIKKNGGYASLSQNLIEAAELRLENPEATLAELGKLFNPPVGKSGVNHRLKKICEYAENMRMR